MDFKVNAEVLQSTLTYLSTKPFAEVANLIVGLKQSQRIVEPVVAPVKDAAKDTAKDTAKPKK
jgi:hypothetical protein